MQNNLSTFFISDIKKLLIKKKYKILIFSLFCFIYIFLYLLTFPIIYESKGTFFEEKNQTTGFSGNLKDLILKQESNSKIEATSFFKTKVLIKKLVRKLGLQISEERAFTKWSNFVDVAKKNLKLEFNKKIIDADEFEFSDVFYDKKAPFYFYLKVLDPFSFQILDNNKHLTYGQINTPIELKGIKFTIKKIPKVALDKTIEFKIDSQKDIIAGVLSNIKISKDKTNPNFLNLTYQDQNRRRSSLVLNSLMQLYQEHLIEDAKNFKNHQLDYLENRKKELESDLAVQFKNYESFLKNNVKTKGFLGLDFEIANLLASRANDNKKLSEINVNLKFLNTQDADFLKIYENIKKLKYKKNQLSLQLKKDLFLRKEDFKKSYKKDREIKKLIDEKKNIQNLIFSLEENRNFNTSKFLKYQSLFTNFKSPSFLNYLNEKLNIISSQIDILKKSTSFTKKNLYSYDLSSLNGFFLEYSKKTDDIKLEILPLEDILKNIDRDAFDLKSLLSFVSQDKIQNALDVLKKIKDKENYTKKEIFKLKSEYLSEKKELKDFFKNLIDIKKMNLAFFEKQRRQFKEIELELYEKEISYLSKKSNELLLLKKRKLNGEKDLVLQKLKNIKIDLKNLASKINLEKEFQFESERTISLIDSIAKLIESKTLDFNLKKIKSKIIDLATSPDKAQAIHLMMFSIIAFLFGAFFSSIFFLYMAVINGFPISLDAIKALSYHYSGKISFNCNGFEIEEIKKRDLETLRKIITLLGEDKHKIITSIASSGPNFTHYLAALLAIIGKNILVIETKSKPDQREGLFTFLERKNKKPAIQKLQAYDFLPAGEEKYFGFELLKSEDMTFLLDSLKKKYDYILIYSPTPVNSAESRVFLKFSDKIILTIKDEILDDLKIFMDMDKSKSKLSFVSY